MKKAVVAAVALCVAALSIAAGSALADNVRFGVNDDEGMFEKGTGPFFTNLAALGMHDNTVTVRWDETSPNGFENLGGGVTLQNFLPQVVSQASRAGVTLTFDVYPRHSQAAGNPTANAPRFAAWLKTLAQTYPSVTHYVVMNECNQPLFVNPQYDAHGNLLSAAACGQFLAAGYQALKSVDPDIFVWGLGLSPHGAKVDGKSHRDSDPFSFLSALGAWYRSSPYSGQQIMDGLDLHPYPIPQSVPFAQGNSTAYGPAYGVATLPLVYQAFYGAFSGTAQPTVGSVGHLPVSLNEVGIQTVPTAGGYTGKETANWGIDGTTGSEDFQAQWYKQLIDAAQCDADITNVNIFKLIDQSDLGAWQSGLYQLGWVAKESASTVKAEIANVRSCPTGTAGYWTPAGAPADDVTATGSVTGPFSTYFKVAVDQFLTQQQQLFASFNVSLQNLLQRLQALFGVASSQLAGMLSLQPASAQNGRRVSSARVPKAVTRKFTVRKGKRVVLPRIGKLAAGSYTLTVVLTAKRSQPVTITSPVFALDAKGKLAKAVKAAAKPAKSKGKKPAHGSNGKGHGGGGGKPEHKKR
ncbi:MAG TPA: hypothetical protein VHC67_09975 [Gaiellaceae bacterium]|nr:hypothetical protein [Gaiellaceae bacterium]